MLNTTRTKDEDNVHTSRVTQTSDTCTTNGVPNRPTENPHSGANCLVNILKLIGQE